MPAAAPRAAPSISSPSRPTDRNFYNAETTFGTDHTKRVTLDVNQVISPTISVRAGGMFQDANVAGRNYVTDDRWGGFISTKWTPTDDIKITTNYVHTDLNGLPDFGVPYYRQGNVPVTEAGIPRQNWYGFVNRDFQTARQDFGTLTGEYKVNDNITLNSRTRAEHSLLAYIGTLPQSPVTTNPNPLLWTFNASPQSRNQWVDVVANQEDATFKFNTGAVKHTTVVGLEVSNERVGIDRYSGLSSEAFGPGAFSGNGALPGQSIYAPSYTLIPFTAAPSLSGNPTRYNVDSKSVYVIETANWQDTIILNGGLRYDGYDLRSSNNTASTTVNADLVNYNVGAVYKPLPIGSLYAAYATSSNPFGSELDATGTDYGSAPPTGTTILGPERNKAAEVGTKWELFDRHLLVTAALFQTEKTNARESVNRVLQSGAAYQIQGIDLEVSGNPHRSLERFRWSGAHEVEGDAECARFQHRAADGQHRPSILQPAEQVQVRRRLGARRAGDLPLEDLWRHLRRQHRHGDSQLLAVRCFRREEDRQELEHEALRAEPDQQALLRHALPQRGAVCRGRAGASILPGHFGEVLIVLICVPDVLGKRMWRISAASWTAAPGRTAARPPARSRRW